MSNITYYWGIHGNDDICFITLKDAQDYDLKHNDQYYHNKDQYETRQKDAFYSVEYDELTLDQKFYLAALPAPL